MKIKKGYIAKEVPYEQCQCTLSDLPRSVENIFGRKTCRDTRCVDVHSMTCRMVLSIGILGSETYSDVRCVNVHSMTCRIVLSILLYLILCSKIYSDARGVNV